MPLRVLLLALAALACAASGPSAHRAEDVLAADRARAQAVVEARRARGAEILRPFKSALKQALQEGLREGPAAAINVCRLRAPALAEERSRAGVRVGRTSHRLRNPDNAPAAWMEPLLARYLEASDRREPAVVSLPRGRVGYLEPIHTGALCLTCHGSELAQPVREALDRHYPEDRATGFAVGELRGLFWAEFPAAE